MGEGSLVVDTLVYLTAAVICVPIAARLKLGSVLGYLAAGCIIGPFGLDLTKDPQATLHFAEFGVVLMLFVIGLELDIKHLMKLRRPIFRGGTVQMLACSIPLFVFFFVIRLPWEAALVASIALGLSSTAVAMQTMAERKLANTGLGKTGFALLLFQDIAAIPLIAVVPMMASAEVSGDSGWLVAGKALAAVVLVVLIGRFLTRPLLRIVAQTGLREIFMGFTLLLVLGIALLMAASGVSMALGAFLAGVLLASSEYRHALETDIQPFKGLLMGLFFIAVGMSIDFGLLIEQPLVVLGLLGAFSFIKLGMLRWIAGPLEIPAKQRWLFAALLAQGGEFAFVVFGVARTASVLPAPWDGLLTLTVALSMALTPVWLIAHDRFLTKRNENQRDADTIEDDSASVIIAGFGRFGQIVGRLLLASGVKATVLDHDPDQIDLLRKFGFRVYYGDATRLDLLHAAGAAKAKVFVLAIDDPDTSVALVDTLLEAFPGLKIVARARNVPHYYELRNRGVDIVERETFESALVVGRAALSALGVGKYEANERANRFRRMNIGMLERMLPHMADEKRRVEMAKNAMNELERQFAHDMRTLSEHGDLSWHNPTYSRD